MKKILVTITLGLILSLLIPFHYVNIGGAAPLTVANFAAADPGAHTVFAYFNTGSKELFKSGDSGSTWAKAGLGSGLNGQSLVALEISPAFSTDNTLLAATSSSLFKSTNGGSTFSNILNIASYDIDGTITSLALGPQGKILIGTFNGENQGSVLLFNGETWKDLKIGEEEVYAVAFSPNYASDTEILALTYNGDSVRLETLINNNGWNKDFQAAVLYSEKGLNLRSAALAFPGNYNYQENACVFAGLNGAGSGSDLYRVYFSGSKLVTDLDTNGTKTSCNVFSLAIAGILSTGHIAVGQADTNSVKYATGLSGNPITWNSGSIPPQGTSNAGLKFNLDDYGLTAVTTGTGYGLFYSYNWGNTFNTFLQPVNGVDAIDDLRITATTANSISLAWTSPQNPGIGNYMDLRYLETTPITETNWNSAVQISYRSAPETPSTYTFPLRGLQPHKIYYFAIKTGHDWSWSTLSNCPSGTTPAASDKHAPLAVTDLKVKSTSSSSVTLTWTAPGDPDPHGWGEDLVTYPVDDSSDIPIYVNFKWPAAEGTQTYEFQLAYSSSFETLLDSKTGLTGPNYTKTTPLNYNTTYFWRVRSIYASGKYSSWVIRIFTTMAAPTVHTQYDIRYSAATITENNWADAVQCTGETVPMAAGSTETFAVKQLKSKTTYYFALKTGDQIINWSAMSNVCSGKTKDTSPGPGPGGDTDPPGKINDLKVTGTTSDSATLQWTATGDDGYSGTATSYDIRYLKTNTLNSDTWDSATQASGEPPPQKSGILEIFTLKGLTPETTCYFGIRAIDEAGNHSAVSNVVSGTTLDTTPPDPITDLTVSEKSSNSFTMTWTATGDDGKAGTASQYDIRYTRDSNNKNYDSWTQVALEPKPQAAGSKEKMVVGGLDPGAIYYFVIRVADEVPNWSAIYNSITAETLPITTPTPTYTGTPIPTKTGFPIPTTITPTPTITLTPTPSPSPARTSAPDETGRSPTPIGGGGGMLTPQSVHRPDDTAPNGGGAGPVFSVTALTLSKDKVSTGETVKVTAVITNSGNQSGSYTAQFKVNDEVENKTEVTSLAPGADSTVEFEFKKDAAGSYNLQVGEKASTVQVEAAKAVRAWIWILIALIILVIILLILRQVLHWGFKK